MIKQADVKVPIFDTTLIHSEKAVERALKMKIIKNYLIGEGVISTKKNINK